MNSQDLFNRSVDVDQALARHIPNADRPAIGPLVSWAAFNLGGARMAVGLIDTLAQDNGLQTVQSVVGDEPFDMLEVGALSVGVRSAVTALDLCAAALYRLVGGPAWKDPQREADVGTWGTDKVKGLTVPQPLENWITGLRGSVDWKFIEDVRHGITHRYFNRHVKGALGGARSPIDEIVVNGQPVRIDQVISKAVDFATDQYLAFCAAVITVYP